MRVRGLMKLLTITCARRLDEDCSRVADVGTVDAPAICYDTGASTAAEADIGDHLEHFVVTFRESLRE